MKSFFNSFWEFLKNLKNSVFGSLGLKNWWNHQNNDVIKLLLIRGAMILQSFIKIGQVLWKLLSVVNPFCTISYINSLPQIGLKTKIAMNAKFSRFAFYVEGITYWLLKSFAWLCFNPFLLNGVKWSNIL